MAHATVRVFMASMQIGAVGSRRPALTAATMRLTSTAFWGLALLCSLFVRSWAGMALRCLIVDDSPSFRDAMRALLEA